MREFVDMTLVLIFTHNMISVTPHHVSHQLISVSLQQTPLLFIIYNEQLYSFSHF